MWGQEPEQKDPAGPMAVQLVNTAEWQEVYTIDTQQNPSQSGLDIAAWTTKTGIKFLCDANMLTCSWM